MSAIRLARGFTGRSKIIKFAGCYHGHVDALLAAAGSGRGHARAARFARGHRRGGERDDRAAVQRRGRGRGGLRASRTDIAAIITEAAAGNMGVIAPLAGFNQRLAEIAHAHGALLVVDEVMTGFRVSAGGWAGLDPVDADLFTFGKVMGGGLPAAAFGGRSEIMSRLAPAGPVYQAGHAVR